MTETRKGNIHATAIVLGTRGLLFVGPSGSGKSSIALSCLAAAQERGLFGALVADDQVFVSDLNGRLVANRPASIAGLAEIRGSGIVKVPSIASAVIDCAVLPVRNPQGERLPPEDEVYVLPGHGSLPQFRLPLLQGTHPFDILRLALPQNLRF